MAENVVINIEANTSGLTETINLLTKLGVVEKSVAEEFQKTNAANVASIQKGVQSTTKEFEKLDKAVKGIKSDNGLAKALDVSADVAKVGNTFQSLRTQLKEATIEAQNLAEQFGELDPRTLAAAQRAAQLKDSIGDVNAQIQALTPEGKFQAIQNLGGAIAGVFQVATGALQAFGVESEQATKIAQQFQGALNIFGGLSQLTQLGDSLTAVKAALGLTTTATVAQTAATESLAVAEGQQAVAAGAATGAQNALNASMLANPYVLVAAGLVAVVAALVAFSDTADDAKDKYESLLNAAEQTTLNFDANLRALERQEKIRLSDLDTQIKIAQLEGKSAKDIGDLEKQRLDTQRQYINFKLKANNDAINSDIKVYDNLFKLGDEESLKKAAELGKQIDARKRYADELLTEGELLKNEFILKEKEITVAIKKEQEERLKNIRPKVDYEIDFIPPKDPLELADIVGPSLVGNVEDEEIVVPVRVESDAEKRWDAAVKKLNEFRKANQELIQESAFNVLGAQFDNFFENNINRIDEQKQAQMEALDEESQAIEEAYNNRLIGKRNFELQQEALEKKRADAAIAAEKKIAAERRKADIAKRAIALFDIFLNTRRAITAVNADPTIPTVLKPGFVAQLIVQGAVQAAAVLAQPLPKYKKGTLSVGGVGSDDSQLALLQPGEAVIPTDTNRKYHPAIKAIYQNKIRPEDINAFVKMRLRGDVGKDAGSSVTAKMDIADIYALGRIIKKNDGVTIKNVKELASIFADNNNPRR